jgi:hypothetical protein
MCIALFSAMPHIVAVLSSGSTNDVKLAAAVAIENLASHTNGQPNVAIALALTGAVPSLVAMLNSNCTYELQQAATGALWKLSYNTCNIATAIARAGAIPLLIAMLSAGCGTDKLKQAAALALKNLADIPDADSTNVLIVKTGAILPLIAMLSADGAVIVKEAAVILLSELATNADNRVKITAAGAIPPLVAIMNADGGECVTKAAARALRILGIDDSAYYRAPKRGRRNW